MKKINFWIPPNFNKVHLDKLYKGMKSRFRFGQIDIHQKDDVISIGFCGGDDMPDRLSDYFNGFYAAIE